MIDVSFLYADRDARREGQLRIPAGGRTTIPVRRTVGLSGTRASVELVSVNAVRVVAERTTSGVDSGGSWRRATVGARASATSWVMPTTVDGDLVFSNVSTFSAKVRVHFGYAYSEGDTFDKVIDMPARSRFVYPQAAGFSLPGDPFPRTSGTLRVTSQPTANGTAELVVEGLAFQDDSGSPLRRPSGVLATPVP